MYTYKRKLSFGLAMTFVAVLPLLLLVKKQQIIDWTQLRNYKPDSIISKLAVDTTMSNLGRHLFYVNHPTLHEKSTFAGHCKISELTNILGCYVSGDGIYLYDVKDPRLSGIKEATSAHEMLHVAYERLSATEKVKVNKMLLDVYSKVTDTRIKNTIASYKKAGADTTNELHSILGTEILALTPDLENYYKKYFTNRTAVVKYFNQYQNAFEERKNKVEQYDISLASIKSRIENLEYDLKNEASSLENERSRMNNLIANNQVSEYNQAVPIFNRRIEAYNNKTKVVKQLVDDYNGIVIERNNIATEENELIKAIDSSPVNIKV